MSEEEEVAAEVVEEEKRDNGKPVHRGIRRYYCEFCGICRSKKALIASHVLSEHKDEIGSSQTDNEKKTSHLPCYTCEECGSTYLQHGGLTVKALRLGTSGRRFDTHGKQFLKYLSGQSWGTGGSCASWPGVCPPAREVFLVIKKKKKKCGSTSKKPAYLKQHMQSHYTECEALDLMKRTPKCAMVASLILNGLVSGRGTSYEDPSRRP